MGTSTGHYIVSISRTVFASQYDSRRTSYQGDEANQVSDNGGRTNCAEV